MNEQIQFKDSSWLMIPYYSNPTDTQYSNAVAKFEKFIGEAKGTSGLNLMVVDDGCGLNPEQFGKTVDWLVTLPINRGKAYAIRAGLGALAARESVNMGFIVQYDGDGDQPVEDIPRVYDRLLEVSEGDPNKPILVIGNRYSEGLKTPPNPESVTYRQSLLIFFGALARQLGADNTVRDWVSGARGYTASYATEFLAHSKSDRYGVESEQLIIGGLIGANITTATLSDSRPRDPWTLTSKWLQNFEIYRAHSEALREKGKGHVVDLVSRLVEKLKDKNNEFDLDLSSVGENTLMHFRRWGEVAHSAEIPSEYRLEVFDDRANFPFTLRREPLVHQ